MTIIQNQEGEKFNYKDFAKNLASEANKMIPIDISLDDGDFIIEIIGKFCELAGGGIEDDKDLEVNTEIAKFIIQIIGEWTYHKSIDLTRSNIPLEHREPILQKIAFAIFEVIKQSVKNNVENSEIVELADKEVQKTYKEALEALKNENILSEDLVKQAQSQSNIDIMAQENLKKMEEEHRRQVRASKFITIAFLLKKLPKSKIAYILDNMNENDAKDLLYLLNVPNFNTLVQYDNVINHLQEIKVSIPQTDEAKLYKINRKLYNLLKDIDKASIIELIQNERKNIKQYVINILEQKDARLPLMIANIVYEHLESKVAS